MTTLKPHERQFFDAFFWEIKVPLRVFDKNGKTLITHALVQARKYLRAPDMALLKKCTEPQILKVGQHELIGVLPLRGLHVVVGPVLIVEPDMIPSLYELSLVGDALNDKVDIREVIPVLSPTRLCAHLRLMSLSLLRRDINTNETLARCLNVSAKQIDKEVVKSRFDSIETHKFSAVTFRDEKLALSAIREGNREKLKAYRIDAEKFNLGGYMSSNQLRNMKYLGVCVTSLIAQAANEGGLSDLDVYTLCGTYVQHVDLADSPAQIYSVLITMMNDFCDRVAAKKEGQPQTKTVSTAVSHIKSHTHQRLTVQDVAAVVGVSKDILYREFIKQTGLSPAAYIQSVKIDEAKDLLENTAFSATEIAAYLDFSSQSHFIDVFKKHTGMTPKEYRNK